MEAKIRKRRDFSDIDVENTAYIEYELCGDQPDFSAYTYGTKHSIVLRNTATGELEEFEFVIRKICNYNNEKQNLKIDLIYKASVDSDKAKIFHEKCDNAKSTIVLVRSGNRKRFGGFTFKNWKGISFKKDDKAFVFSIDKKKYMILFYR